jgi:hypothetical protein
MTATKEALKTTLLRNEQGQEAELDLSLMDIHRMVQKNEGGVYELSNCQVLTPEEHQRLHNNYVDRSEEFEELKSFMDARRQAMKAENGANNRMLAYKRNVDRLDENTLQFCAQQAEDAKKHRDGIDKKVLKAVNNFAENSEFLSQAIDIASVGPVTVAYCLVYIDLYKADTVSKLWSYAGLHKPNYERYQKGETSGGNKTLRTALYTFAESVMKNKNSPYRAVYDSEKAKKEVSEQLTWTRNTQGKLVQVPWKETKPGHRNGHALRQVMKFFLSDFHFVGRTLMGLPVRPVYAEDKLGHINISHPNNRGWNI